MNKKKVKRIALVTVIAGVVVAASIAALMFFKSHRDVQSTKTDLVIAASTIVAEYLDNAALANEKYLDDAGLSKVLEVTGTVASISEDYNNQKVVLLKSNGDKAGVSATFTAETNASAEALKVGEFVKIKGVIRSGASYDKDLGLYEHVILEKSDVIKKP